ncbi:MAG: hypothetical protein HKM93_20305 [Desulfobacteraceae bacterium]|nr:hypothetical protein [Desulfobacteraceae bacterium]
MKRKLSDIFIEIALQGLKEPKYGNSEIMHPLMILAHIAWQRETSDPNFMEGQYEEEIAKFNFPQIKIKTELISTDWSSILERMRNYKRLRFPDDNRIVTLCGFTPRNTLRVEWKEN